MDSGSCNGVLLESVNVTIMVWIVWFSLWKGRSAGRATLFCLSSRTGLVMHCFHCCGLRTVFGLVDEEHLQGIQQSSRHYFWKIFCTDRCQYLLVSATSSTVLCFFGIEGMAKFILDVEFSMYRRNECHVERGCGSLYPLGGTT